MSVVITLILAFVFLHEEFSLKMLIGSVLITAGTLVMVLWKAFRLVASDGGVWYTVPIDSAGDKGDRYEP